ncbi:MAG: ABC transporter ATP-binding protein [Oscillospiraceae bacterium]|jgi:ABC-2 type transport system ATP-binding protein|nr:ABC transporter ATP-binding protein [Oscillospiraceae bacterium]
MIEVRELTKTFGSQRAVDNISCTIDSGCIYGLVGSNGAGKSTLLRLITGVYRPDAGDVRLSGRSVCNDPMAKQRMIFVADELFFLPGANMRRMARLYAAEYPAFSHERLRELAARFGLDMNAGIQTFSKGMRRQAAILLSLCCHTDYILLDETFDGLDPVMRALVKRTLYEDIEARRATAVISSHSLRELEDTCDQLALMHRGGLVFESDVQNLKTTLFKVQVAFSEDFDRTAFGGVEILSFEKQGSVARAIVRGDRDEMRQRLAGRAPLLLEILPLSLEEVFVYELEALGYAFGGDEEVEKKT